MGENKEMTSTGKIVITALFTALIMVATIVIQIPLPFGYVNLGDVFVLLSVFLLGTTCSMISAGLGSALADLILGYAIYAPASFVIKALMALVASVVVLVIKKEIKNNIVPRVIAGIIAEFIMVLGYFFYDAVVLGYSWSASASIVGNCIQGVVGIFLSIIIVSVLDRINLNKNITEEDKVEQNDN